MFKLLLKDHIFEALAEFLRLLKVPHISSFVIILLKIIQISSVSVISVKIYLFSLLVSLVVYGLFGHILKIPKLSSALMVQKNPANLLTSHFIINFSSAITQLVVLKSPQS